MSGAVIWKSPSGKHVVNLRYVSSIHLKDDGTMLVYSVGDQKDAFLTLRGGDCASFLAALDAAHRPTLEWLGADGLPRQLDPIVDIDAVIERLDRLYEESSVVPGSRLVNIVKIVRDLAIAIRGAGRG